MLKTFKTMLFYLEYFDSPKFYFCQNKNLIQTQNVLKMLDITIVLNCSKNKPKIIFVHKVDILFLNNVKTLKIKPEFIVIAIYYK